ncbi:MAG TPA: TIGR01841 family phasin [Alphaproteobacteria bacterium]|nr:TIGR01841 family phasin [Alphaproteobacteria bacterium]HOO51787.1 TIGR01841 family phasin [Alphaproteobacteria bacterium]
MQSPFDKWMKPEYLSNFSAGSAFPAMNGMKDAMEFGRKSIQAYAEAGQITMDSFQTVMQRQSEILSQLVQDNSSMAQEIINEGTPEEKLARGAELIRQAYEKTVCGMQEVNDICSKSSKEACDVINKRISACLEEVQNSVQENSAKSKKSSRKSA